MANIWMISEWEITIRILLAALCGGLIGLEREWSNHAAGFRTHILVCIGSAAIMLLSIYGFPDFVDEPNVRVDPARLAAQVISGIGFLGAGAILRTGATVSGLTTAASIWVVAAIGLSIGAGFFYSAGLATVMVLLSLFVLNKWEKHWKRNRRYQAVSIQILNRPGSLGRILLLLGEEGIQIVNIKMKHVDHSDAGKSEPVMDIMISVKASNSERLLEAMGRIASMEEVLAQELGGWQPQSKAVKRGKAYPASS